jgi:hexosaminidase
LNILPRPRELKRGSGFSLLPTRAVLQLEPSLPAEIARTIRNRIQRWSAGLRPGTLRFETSSPRTRRRNSANIRVVRNNSAPDHAEGYALTIDGDGVLIQYRHVPGLHAAIATLRQLLREYSRRLPHLKIRDWPDFSRRGVMLDISRGRVPKLETLIELVEHLADFKINEFQLYTEHTFAYRHYRSVWRKWGALTAAEIQKLDARCRELGIELVPNQNSFGHARYWLAHPPLQRLAEISAPYEAESGDFLRYPSTLAPTHPGTLRFLRGLYDELLPNFTSRFFNVGCDETWDLGRGQSRRVCERKGKGRVYLEFLKQIHREVSVRGRRMMFWGDIILHYPELISQLPKGVIALNWGYEAAHPFDREARRFAQSGRAFYVCPGTSSWMTLIGRHDNALKNLRRAAHAGRKHGAIGYLITDWGDGGHPQPLAVSYLPYLAGAALSWCANNFDARQVAAVLDRDVFRDRTERTAKVAAALGLAHRKFKCLLPNATPFGIVIAAPPPELRELFCRDGLKCYAQISPKRIRAALAEVNRHIHSLQRAGRRSSSTAAEILRRELELAARMAAQSCKFMLWQHALADGKKSAARQLAKTALRELRQLEREFKAYWPSRNKGSTEKSTPFFRWRRENYRRGLQNGARLQQA